jgi:hypothetical protein
MRKCKDCNLILDETARFCPKCGKELTDAEGMQQIPKLEVGAYLTSANLHRIRREWDEAIADATEALRIEPNNADIASLLGVIYQEQGMLDEAMTWLQMALEMNPDSTSDKARLKQVKDQILQRSIVSRQRDHLNTFEKRTRIWAITMTAAFIIVVVFAFILATGKRNRGAATTANPKYRAGYSSTFHGGELPSTPPITSSKMPSRQSSASRQTVGRSDTGNASTKTPAEVKISKDTSQADGIGSAKVDDVIADPRQGVITITCTIPYNSFAKNTILANASAISKAAFASNSEVKAVTVRCVVTPAGTSSTQIAFVGDISRQSLQVLGASPTADQITGSFTNIWWNPQID